MVAELRRDCHTTRPIIIARHAAMPDQSGKLAIRGRGECCRMACGDDESFGGSCSVLIDAWRCAVRR